VLLEAIHSLDLEEIARARYDGSCEDMFFFVENLLRRSCGELAGKMHTARSRNDIAITLFRMAHRRQVLGVASDVANLRSALLQLAGQHMETVMPAHTHTQPPSPRRWPTIFAPQSNSWSGIWPASAPPSRASTSAPWVPAPSPPPVSPSTAA